MNWAVRYRSSVEKDMARSLSRIRAEILDRLRSLEADPFPAGCKKLKGQKNRFRLKVAGDYGVARRVRRGRRIRRPQKGCVPLVLIAQGPPWPRSAPICGRIRLLGTRLPAAQYQKGISSSEMSPSAPLGSAAGGASLASFCSMRNELTAAARFTARAA